MTASYLALLLADGRFPTGAHTQSAGFEPALREGLRLAEVPDYLRVRLATVVEVEAATAIVAGRVWKRSAVPDGAGEDPAGVGAERSLSLSSCLVEVGVSEGLHALREVDRAWRVRTLSDALREASDLLGRSYLRTAAAVWDLGSFARGPGPWCRGVVVGVVAACAGLNAEETARLVAYEDVQTVISAALKLEPFDPSVAVRWAAGAALDVEALVARVEGVETVEDIPAHSAPLVEQWGPRHQTNERRLFRA